MLDGGGTGDDLPADGLPIGGRLPERLDAVERGIEANDHRIRQLEVDMGEIRAYLGQTATKADVAELGQQIAGAINGILRDALNAVPARHAAIWGGVAAIATVGMLIVVVLHL
ncbi:MAG: hypothetical protein ACREFP_04045 [Acetobacteraceae bacterium]